MSTKNKKIYKILNILETYNEWNDLEYIFIDKTLTLTPDIYDNLLKNKIIITEHENNLHMLDENKDTYTLLDSIPTVDLIIMSNNINSLTNKYIKKLIDEDNTIISKILSDNMYYIADMKKKLHIIITNNNTFVFKGYGVNLRLLNHTKNKEYLNIN
ncbi:hypothetical protein [Methanosphaera stadtmanae]|uniref:hypothetical protein n=1 Tax=Methanosphaera stadtmanae TaxID=2317 RepID=UPI002596941D|nr:hypothetical protein [Methanosphaera stadtmanae]